MILQRMTRRMLRLCANCNYHLTNEKYCEKCKIIIAQNKRYLPKNKKRPDKFYESDYWRSLRKFVLIRDNYLCQICLSKGKYVTATEVDHIVPLKEGGTNELNNLQSLCKSCHSRKTRHETSKQT